eukprot:scpid43676/ scgid2883/ Zinc finger CCHC domain-containing protein 2
MVAVCKDDVLLWFKESSASSRVNVYSGMLKCCTPFELRYFFTLLEDALKDCYQSLRSAEQKVNKFITPPPAASPRHVEAVHPCAAAKLSNDEDRANLLATLALLKGTNHTVASQLLYPVLSTIKKEYVASENDAREEFLLMLNMAASHPAFSFAERRIFWDKIDTLCEAVSVATPGSNDHDRGLLKKERCQEARTSVLSFMDDWADTGTTNWAESGDVVPDIIIVSGCQKSKGSGRFDTIRFEYIFEVTWSDGTFNRCFKTYNDLFQFQNKLLNENAVAAGKGASPRIIPFLPGKKLLTKATRELAEKRLPEIAEYAQKLTELPQYMLTTPLVVDFFNSVTTTTSGTSIAAVDGGGTLEDSPITVTALPASAGSGDAVGAATLLSGAGGDSNGSSVSTATSQHHSPDGREAAAAGSDIAATPVLSGAESSGSSAAATSKDSQDSLMTIHQSEGSLQVSANTSLARPRDQSSLRPGSTRPVPISITEVDEEHCEHQCVPRLGGGVVYFKKDQVMTTTSLTFLEQYGSASRLASEKCRRSSPSGSGMTGTAELIQLGTTLPDSITAGSLEHGLSERSSVASPSDLPSSHGDDSSGLLLTEHRHTEPTQRRRISASSSTTLLSRTGSCTSLASRTSASTEVKTFSSLQDWLRALRLHKYSSTLEEYNFSTLMRLTSEELDALEMTAGARSKLVNQIEWMKKNDCDQFAILYRGIESGKKNRNRAGSMASMDLSDSSSQVSVGGIHSGGGAAQKPSQDTQAPKSSVSPSSSAWSLPDIVVSSAPCLTLSLSLSSLS